MLPKIKLLIADLHDYTLLGLRSHFSGNGYEIIGEAKNWEDLVNLSLERNPEVTIADFNILEEKMNPTNREIRDYFKRNKVLVFSRYREKEALRKSLDFGARGYVLKSDSAEDIETAVKAVAINDSYISESMKEFLPYILSYKYDKNGLRKSPVLTDKQLEVLAHLSTGLTNRSIANILGLAVRTIETHRERIMKKTGKHEIASLTHHALSLGITNVGDYVRHKRK